MSLRSAQRNAVAFLAVTLFAIADYYRTWSPVSLLGHLTRFERITSYRIVDGVTFLVLGYFLAPRMRRYLKPPSLTKHWYALPLLILLFISPYLSEIYAFRHDLTDLARAFYWVFAIGFNEEFISRFLIFGLLKKYVGLWPATIISAVNFGMMHFGNLNIDGQGLQETTIQVVGASCFGFMAVALMLYFRSIWVPILIHGITDLSLSVGPQRASATATTGGISGHGISWLDWASVLTQGAFEVLIGITLLTLARYLRCGRRIRELASYLKLTM